MRNDLAELACVTMTVNVPAAALWRVLADFGHPQVLAPTIERCTLTGSGVGAVRIVESSRGLVIHERLNVCDRDAWRFQYEVLDSGDMPFSGVAAYRATVTLRPLDVARTEVEWRTDGAIEGDAGAATAAIESLYRAAIANLAQAAQA